MERVYGIDSYLKKKAAFIRLLLEGVASVVIRGAGLEGGNKMKII